MKLDVCNKGHVKYTSQTGIVVEHYGRLSTTLNGVWCGPGSKQTLVGYSKNEVPEYINPQD